MPIPSFWMNPIEPPTLPVIFEELSLSNKLVGRKHLKHSIRYAVISLMIVGATAASISHVADGDLDNIDPLLWGVITFMFMAGFAAAAIAREELSLAASYGVRVSNCCSVLFFNPSQSHAPAINPAISHVANSRNIP